MTNPLDAIREERFWAKVNKTEHCWEWTGSRVKKNSYGSFGVGRGSKLAHRISYLLTHGEIPSGLLVCHRCNNKGCVNPSHLYLATNQQNIKDAFRDGLVKKPKPKAFCPKGHALRGNNLYITPPGHRACKECRKENGKRWRRKQK